MDIAIGKLEKFFLHFYRFYTEYFTLWDCFRFSQIRSGPVNEAL